MSFFDTKLSGDLLQRIGDHSRVQSFLTTKALNVLFSFLSLTIFGIVLFIYDKLIFFTYILGTLVYAIWLTFFLKKRKFIDYELFEKQSKNNSQTWQFITSMQEIKLQDCEKRRSNEWELTQNDLLDVQLKDLRLKQIQEVGSMFITELKNIIITVLAATSVINGNLTLGGMLAIQFIVGQLNSPVAQIMQFIYSFQDVNISLDRIQEIHCKQNEESNENLLTKYRNDSPYAVTFENVSFRYNLHSPLMTLDNLNFSIPKGKITAIVGSSGSGETTLIKLMLGYYNVEKGMIKIKDEDINAYNLKWWRKQCGVVMQDGVIFSESIARNIAVNDGEIDDERMVSAAKIACIHDYITELPLKYDTKIGKDGRDLSQGQKQRILIARAVYRDPDFIFLDEATNALDAKNERIIVENLNKFYEGRTVVIVAHRLSTVKNADQILVLENGKLVEVGDHKSLIDQKGIYYSLIQNQLELGT